MTGLKVVIKVVIDGVLKFLFLINYFDDNTTIILY